MMRNTASLLFLSRPSEKTLQILRFLFRFSMKLFGAFLLVMVSSVAGLGTAAALRLKNLPDVRRLAAYDPAERSEIVTSQGVVLKEIYGEENRKVVRLKDMPISLPNAIMAIEDVRFREHLGVDPIGILRALKANFESNETVQGGSTLTQQVVKNLFLTPERSYARKAAEAILSVRMDQSFTKDQILEIYANLIYFGHNAYGVQAAAETYFGKDAKDLNLGEAAMIAGLIRGPELYSPYHNYARARQRQSLVLNKMAENHFITQAQAQAAKQVPLKLAGLHQILKYPYYTTYVMAYLKRRFSLSDLETKGYRVVTTLDPQMQETAHRVLNTQVQSLRPYNLHQGALVTVDATTGYIKALVGGTSFHYGQNEFNRVYQAHRQTGSSFKPFVYATAFENGMTPDTVVMDSPVSYPDGPGRRWSPQNYGRGFSGAVTIKRALMQSINVVAVKVMDQVGIDKVIEMTQRLGIKSPVRPYLSSALGASEITPLEMVRAYSAFANDGMQYRMSPILKIEDKHGKIIFDNTQPVGKRVLDKDVVRSLNLCLQAVVSGGTGAAAQIPGYQVAGKTGTTSSHRDAWFMGYTPHYVTAVWVGNDDNQRMFGATGGGFCAPLWHDYMLEVLKSEKPRLFPPVLPLHRKLQLNQSKGLVDFPVPETAINPLPVIHLHQRINATATSLPIRLKTQTVWPTGSHEREPMGRMDNQLHTQPQPLAPHHSAPLEPADLPKNPPPFAETTDPKKTSAGSKN